jgi:hypothetical protein
MQVPESLWQAALLFTQQSWGMFVLHVYGEHTINMYPEHPGFDHRVGHFWPLSMIG